MQKHSRRCRIVAAKEGAGHFEQKDVLVETQLVFNIGDGGANESDTVTAAMVGGIGFEALDDALIFRQSAKAAVQVRI